MGSDAASSGPLVIQGIFQSTLPGWGATSNWTDPFVLGIFQSTLPGWGATWERLCCSNALTFQSTLPGWGATPQASRHQPVSQYFNPRSPDGERPKDIKNAIRWNIISIHAPRMGSDFQRGFRGFRRLTISIHAPRMGSDGRPAGAMMTQA